MLTTLKRKPYQRRVNAWVRGMNKQLAEDTFLRKRCDVYIRQVKARFERYDDGSGASLHVCLHIVDRVTGVQGWHWFSYLDIDWGWEPWLWVNDFVLDLRKMGDW